MDVVPSVATHCNDIETTDTMTTRTINGDNTDDDEDDNEDDGDDDDKDNNDDDGGGNNSTQCSWSHGITYIERNESLGCVLNDGLLKGLSLHAELLVIRFDFSVLYCSNQTGPLYCTVGLQYT